jgi:hypothetical protein
LSAACSLVVPGDSPAPSPHQVMVGFANTLVLVLTHRPTRVTAVCLVAEGGYAFISAPLQVIPY